jgi:hypothetical protein
MAEFHASTAGVPQNVKYFRLKLPGKNPNTNAYFELGLYTTNTNRYHVNAILDDGFTEG